MTLLQLLFLLANLYSDFGATLILAEDAHYAYAVDTSSRPSAWRLVLYDNADAVCGLTPEGRMMLAAGKTTEDCLRALARGLEERRLLEEIHRLRVENGALRRMLRQARPRGTPWDPRRKVPLDL